MDPKEEVVSINAYTQKGYGLAKLPGGTPIEIAHAVIGDALK
ncbi:MAG: hypothetical protein RL235_622, partial [Chlamydiota bacterium]